MKKILIFILVSLSISKVYSQGFNVEPGITVGSSYYLGDINHTKQFYSPGLTYGIALRHNYNDYYALRLNILRATISGNDADFENMYQKIRAHSFSNTIYEFGLQGEFNFLSFTSQIKKDNAPYITFGVAFVASNNFSSYSAGFPVGIGYKFAPIKKMTISAEWVFRLTTSDKLDLLEPIINSKQITKSNTNDWYSIAGITLSYNFQSDKKWCPAYNKHRKH